MKGRPPAGVRFSESVFYNPRRGYGGRPDQRWVAPTVHQSKMIETEERDVYVGEDGFERSPETDGTPSTFWFWLSFVLSGPILTLRRRTTLSTGRRVSRRSPFPRL